MSSVACWSFLLYWAPLSFIYSELWFNSSSTSSLLLWSAAESLYISSQIPYAPSIWSRPLFCPLCSLWFDATVGSPHMDDVAEPFDCLDESPPLIDSVTVFTAWTCYTMLIYSMIYLATSTSISLVTILFRSYSPKTLKLTWYLWLPYWIAVVIVIKF